MTRSFFRHVALLLALAAAPGCKTLSPTDWAKGWWGGEAEPQVQDSKFPTPVRMAAIWSPAVFNQPGKPPTRGFGGRLYFYDGQNKTVPVEGQLVVYAYNDSQSATGGKTPDRKYAFTPEQFTTHFSETEIGASYSVWIPWDEAGKPQVEISLVPVFTATSGQLVVGQPSRNLLPGPSTPQGQPQTSSFTMPGPVQQRLEVPALGNLPSQPAGISGVQRASFEAPGIPSSGGQSPVAATGVQTTSINLPETLADRLAKARPQNTADFRRPPSFGRPGAIPATAHTAANGQAAAGAIPQPAPADPRATHFVRPRLPVPAAPIQPPTVGPLPYPLGPAAQPSALPLLP